VAAEALAQPGQYARGEIRFALAGQACVQRGCNHGHGYTELESLTDRPASLARIGHDRRDRLERAILRKASAARSSSQERITVPDRHAS